MASISAAARDALVAIHIGMFNAAPGAARLSSMVLDYENGQTLKQIAAGFSTDANFRSQYPGFLTASEFADRMVANLLGDNADQVTKDWSKNYVIGRLNAGVPDTEVFVLAVNALRAATNPDFAVSQTQLENKLEVAKYYAIDLEQNSTDYSVLRSVIASVDENQSSVDTAVQEIGNEVQSFILAAGASSVNEGGTISFNLSTVKVPAGTNIAYTISGVNAADVDGALTGTAVVDSNGKATISVKLLNDLSTEGAETVTVSLDNGRSTASATVNDTSLTPVYTVTAGAATANEGETITFSVAADTAVTGTAAVTIAGITAADVEALPTSVDLVDGKGTITLVLKNDIATEGTETVSVTVGSSTATTAVADTSVAPILGTDSASGTVVSGQGTAIITPATILSNDFGADGKAIATDTAVTIVAGSATKGEVFTTKDGNFLFVASSGERTGSFKYTVAGQEGEGTVNVTLNSAPSVTVTALAATEDTDAAGTVTVSDADGDALTYTYSAKNGTVTGDGASFTYKGNENYNGSDTITVVVNDGYTTVTKDIAVTVAAVDDAPAAVTPAPAAISTNSGSTVTVDLTKYAADVDSSSLTYTADASTTTKGGTISITGSTATITYAQGGGSAAIGADSFKFTATDGSNPVSGVQVSLDVVNTAPTATNFALAAKTGVTQTVDLTGKATDAEGNTLTPSVTIGSVSNGGSAEVKDGKIVYTSTIGYVGTETVKYTVADGFGGTSTEQTITFTVASNTGGTSGNDLLYGSTSAEAIDGLAGDDTIVGGGGLDTITGGDGNDRVTFSDAAVQILGGAHLDVLVVNSDAVASAFDLSLATNQNIDTSSKNSNNNTVVIRGFENLDGSKASNDLVLNSATTLGAYNAAVGGDNIATTSVKTGSGNDGISFSRATGTVTVETGDGNDTIFVNNDGVGGDNASGKFSIDGGAGNDTINVSSTTAAHTILGGAGNDTITLGTGASSADGGDGNDNITGGTSAETLLGGAGNDTISSGGGNDSIVGGAGNDSLTAGTGADTLWGGDGNDTLVGAAADDILNGDAGDDLFAMGANLTTADTIDGGADSDTVQATGLTGTITLTDYTKITNVEKWDVAAADNNNLVVATASATGLTEVIYRENTTTTKDLSVTGMAAGVGVTLISTEDNKAIGNVTLALANATATTDSLTVTLKGDVADTTAKNVVTLLTTTGIENLTIVSDVLSGTTALGATNANVISTLTDADLKTLTVSGNDALTISAMGASTAPTAINAAGMSAAFAVTMSNASNVSLTGGSANDTFTFGATLNNSDTVDGGGGTGDTLTATVTSATATTGALRISNVENITLTSAGTSTVDLTNVTGASAVNFSDGGGANTKTSITGIASGVAIGLGDKGAAGAYSGETNVALASSSGTADTLTFNLQNTATQTLTLTGTGIETVTLAVNSEVNGDQALTVSGLTATNLKITGSTTGNNDAVTLGTLSTSTTSVDATGFDSIVTATASATATTFQVKGSVVHDITGGAGNDTFKVSTVGTTKLNLSGAGGTDTLEILEATGALDFDDVDAFETITINVKAGVTASPSNVDGLIDANLKTLNVKGGGSSNGVDAAMTITADFNTALTTFDASEFSSPVTLTIGTDDTGADSTITIKGGSGTTDILTVDYAAAATYAPVVSGFETIRITADSNNSSGETHVFNLTNISGASTAIAFATGTGVANTVNVTNYNGSTTLQLGHTAAGGAGAVFQGSTSANFGITLTSATGTADAINVKFVDTNAGNTVTMTAAGVETVNLSVNDAAEAHSVNLAAVDATAGSTQTINVTGGNTGTSFTIADVDSTATVIAAGDFKGNLTITDRHTSAMTITGGSGGDTLRMENASDSLDGGTGTDTLNVAMTGVGGAIIIDLSSTTDQITSYNGQANSAIQKGFENVNLSNYSNSAGGDVTGSSGANVIVGTGGVDVLRGGNGADTITGGGGNDSIDLTETTAAADTVLYTATGDFGDTITGFAADTGADIISFATALLVNGTKVTTLLSATQAEWNANDKLGANDVFVEITTATASGGADTAAEVAAFLTGTQTTFADGDKIVVALNDGSNTYLWYVAQTSTNATKIDAAELTLVGVLNGVTNIADGDLLFA